MKLTHSASAWAARLGMAVLALATPLGAQNLIDNGGFETGSFSSWTQSGLILDTFVSSEDCSGTGSPPHSGNFHACVGEVGGSGFLTQAVPTTPGNLYDINFWLAHLSGTAEPNAYFHASWDDVVFFSNTGGILLYTEFGATLLGNATSPYTELSFEFREDPDWWNLDDVSVMDADHAVIPEPTSVVLLGTGLVGLAGLVRRRRPL